MELAIWLASILGPVVALMGLWVVTKTAEAEKMWASIKATPATLYLGGVINLFIGFTILSLYRTWSMNLAVLVTFLGYMQVLRGVLIFFAHDWMVKVHSKIMKKDTARAAGCLPLAYGLLLCWLAFGG